ncbi:hypothetical protein J7T55_010029 [Diaporthe amygdali]|uniref:uncharacterized protein n=1 Tax=Phomopsis amygdali TaxID=1214568 RepID=UPI0022FF2A3F|nr:uncharacterized protein J7T55_010029 [Diaporthe amygdali]KAJ0116878.1 hypothetical protein J7T55_010029 [Diaporthe amygdali]
MSTGEPSGRTHISSNFKWYLGSKAREGRYGPVFVALRDDTAELITAEQVALDGLGDSAESVVVLLESKLATSNPPGLVSYLGYEVKEEHVFILREYMPGGTIREFIRNYGAIPESLSRSFLRQIIIGLEQMYEQGITVIFLDSESVLLDNKGIVKIEAPLLGVTTTGQPPPSTILTPPELKLGQEPTHKADAWLLGIIAAELLTGSCSLAEGSAASSATAKIEEVQGSAVDLLVPQAKASKLDEQALDFIRQCLSV